jgi:hypothetical protein
MNSLPFRPLALLAAGALLAGCRPPPAGQAGPPAPVPALPQAPAPPPVASSSGATEAGTPAAALREYWKERDGHHWRAARDFLSKGSREALSEQELAQNTKQEAPTAGTGGAWAALFFPAVARQAQELRTSVDGNTARVEVRSGASLAPVVMVRENGAWKIDLLKTMSAPPG